MNESIFGMMKLLQLCPLFLQVNFFCHVLGRYRNYSRVVSENVEHLVSNYMAIAAIPVYCFGKDGIDEEKISSLKP